MLFNGFQNDLVTTDLNVTELLYGAILCLLLTENDFFLFWFVLFNGFQNDLLTTDLNVTELLYGAKL